jgi:glycosyltransferase involved in cell wall biosynthesis
MNKISICIPTYKRPEMLKQLITSIYACYIDLSFISGINIVVVDNDAEKTAQTQVENLKKSSPTLFKLHYHSYSVKGLANVRNELIKKALEFVPDFIVFIDDDEFVTENWLNELVKAVVENNTDAARGPVFASLSNKLPSGIDVLLHRENYPDYAVLKKWTTGNLIIRRTSLEKAGIRFDRRFNATGSEDTFFGREMARKGAKLLWAANAITYEVIPEKRTSINWFIKRAYRGAATYIYMLKIEKDYFQILNKIIVSVVYFLAGLVSIFMIILPVKSRYWGLLKIADAVGAIAGLFNFQYQEYK